MPKFYFIVFIRSGIGVDACIMHIVSILCVCVCASETGGWRKRFDLEPSYAVHLATEH